MQQEFPSTDPARRAQSRQGARNFHVQVGTFSSPANAEQTIQTLRAEGYTPARSSDAAGRHIIAVGPVPTYEMAKAIRPVPHLAVTPMRGSCRA